MTPAKDRAATYRAKQLSLRTAQAKRVEELEAALREIAEGAEPRPVHRVYRNDGVASKHDTCVHGLAMYDDCGGCTSDYARQALEGSAKP